MERIYALTDAQGYQYCVNIYVNFKLKSLLSVKRRKYYLWIDRFIERLEDIMSEEEFYKKIGWEKAYTIMVCEDNRNKLAKTEDKEKVDNG